MNLIAMLWFFVVFCHQFWPVDTVKWISFDNFPITVANDPCNKNWWHFIAMHCEFTLLLLCRVLHRRDEIALYGMKYPVRKNATTIVIWILGGEKLFKTIYRPPWNLDNAICWSSQNKILRFSVSFFNACWIAYLHCSAVHRKWTLISDLSLENDSG